MSTADLVRKALELKALDRLLLAEELLRSLDQPDPALDERWADEALARLSAHRAGQVQGIDAQELFRDLG